MVPFHGTILWHRSSQELRSTGWMSNRGRQNVASFLVLDLHVDWRRGAVSWQNVGSKVVAKTSKKWMCEKWDLFFGLYVWKMVKKGIYNGL